MRHTGPVLLVLAAALCLVALGAVLVADVGRPYPGFFFAADYRIFPVEPAAAGVGLASGDRIVQVDGQSPLGLMTRVRESGAPVRYEVERGGRRFTVELPPFLFTSSDLLAHFAGYFLVSALMLAVGVVVFVQNPEARPNRSFLLYMCLWAVSNVAVPESVLGFRKYASVLVGFVAVVLSVHGWIFFLTYPVNPARDAWLHRHRVVPRLYAAALAVGVLAMVGFGGVRAAAPELLLGGWLYPLSLGTLFSLAAVSFPIKIVALADTRRRAASPLVNQQTTVLLLGIGLGLGCWLAFMLAPLTHLAPALVEPQLGSALVLLYPLAIAYATVRYRLFDTTVVIRRSVVYTALAALVTASYALAIAAANALVARADVARSPWFSGAFVFVVALGVYPLREWLKRVVDRASRES